MNTPMGFVLSELSMFVGGLSILSRQVTRELWRRPFEVGLTMEQMYQVGSRSVPLILVTAISTGMVMSLQFGIGLEKFGGKPYVPKIVVVSILREMGPVFASLMIAARVGAGIASEIGSMVVTQQLDAIRALGTSPIKKIVIPRVVACMITVPLLAAMANVVGILGAMLVAVMELNLDPQFFLLKVETLKMSDLFSGIAKTFFFAAFISITSCYYGINVQEGTKGVGTATTKAVVASSILVLVGDYFLTKLFWIVEQWF